MTILTDARSAELASGRDRVDSFAFIALTLSFALAMLGLWMTAHPRPDIETGDPAPMLIAP